MVSDLMDVFSRYGISPRYGFLPDRPPLQRLSGDYYSQWESVMDRLPALIHDSTVRGVVDKLATLSTSRLTSEEEWHRAYVVLSFLTQAYVWGHPDPAQVLPPQICIPYLEVANHFGLPAVATYAALNLWNCVPRFPEADITLPENVRTISSFTGTSDEEWFFVVSCAIEAEGAKVIPKILECFDAIEANDPVKTEQLLQELVGCIVRIGQILDRMHDRCEPQVFYHQVRPFLAGSKGMADAGLPNGVFYDEGSGSGVWRQYSGGSNAQSTLIQLLDIVLGVEHYALDGAVSTPGIIAMKKRQGYLEEMKSYMPERHREFLKYAAERTNIRAYALKSSTDSHIRRTYIEALDGLATIRNKHLNLVARYIINPSRQPALNLGKATTNIASATSQESSRNGSEPTEFHGTGGTKLMSFLKQTRDETKYAIEMQSAA